MKKSELSKILSHDGLTGQLTINNIYYDLKNISGTVMVRPTHYYHIEDEWVHYSLNELWVMPFKGVNITSLSKKFKSKNVKIVYIKYKGHGNSIN